MCGVPNGARSPLQNISVLGAGLMGAGIAQVSVTKGYEVTLKDAMPAGLARGLAQIEKNLKLKVKKRQMSQVCLSAVACFGEECLSGRMNGAPWEWMDLAFSFVVLVSG